MAETGGRATRPAPSRGTVEEARHDLSGVDTAEAGNPGAKLDQEEAALRTENANIEKRRGDIRRRIVEIDRAYTERATLVDEDVAADRRQSSIRALLEMFPSRRARLAEQQNSRTLLRAAGVLDPGTIERELGRLAQQQEETVKYLKELTELGKRLADKPPAPTPTPTPTPTPSPNVAKGKGR
jgi:hypothetical protein